MVFNPIYYVMAFGARITILLGILIIPGIQTTVTAQLSGTKIVPGNYATIAAAVTDLNAQGVGAGGVTFNVAAGHIEISDIPVMNATGTVANPILFQKSGMGANPKIQPLTAGTVASSIALGVHGDGIFIINGGDYITFDGIDLITDAAFAGNGMYEYGYYFKKATGTDACKNIIIRNCVITLNKAAIYSYGIFISNISGTTSVTVTSTGGRSENIKVYNNTISNAYGGIHVRGFNAVSPFDFYDQNIWIGEDGANSITNFGGGSTPVFAIHAIFQNEFRANNNSISGGDNSTTTMYGILVSTGTNSNIETDGNSISLNNNGAASQVGGIAFQTGPITGTTNTHYITNNTITNFSRVGGGTYFIYITSNEPQTLYVTGNTIGSSSLAGGGAIYGIYQATNGNSTHIANNTISDLNRVAVSTAAFYGINCDNVSATSLTLIYNNTIHTLSSSNTLGALGGIFMKNQTTVDIYKNKIYGLTNDHSAATVHGITLDAGITTCNVFNNLIGNLYAPSINSTTDMIRGISHSEIVENSTLNISYNTIYLDATSTGSNFASSCINHIGNAIPTSSTLNLNNNILVNISTPKGSGLSVAFRRSPATLTNFGYTSERNLFYAGTPGANRLIYYDGTNADQTLATYKDRVTPRDANSITENPPFLSTVGANSNFLHINTASPTQLESAGINITGITQDYDTNIRQGNAGYSGTGTGPDIGADEGAFNGIDLTVPGITYTPLSFTCATGNRTLNVTIVDVTGVPTTGSLQPRIYYKKGAGGMWFSSQGTLLSGNANNSTWQFTIIASDMGGLVVGNVVYYYVIAQDVATTPNIGSNPNAGLMASNVNTVTTHPTTPNTYTINNSISGTISVGAGQTYTTLTAAINAYNTLCVSGPVVFQLTNTTYGPGETFPLVINQNPDANSNNTLTIRPAAGTAVTISGTGGATATALIRLNGADYVTIDGLNTGGASLTIENTSITAGSAALWISSNGLNAGAHHNSILNTLIRAGVSQNTSTTNTYGIVVAGNTLNATTTFVFPGEDNDHNRISGCTFEKVRIAIYFRGGSPSNPNTGTIITNNIIGPAVFGSNEIGKGGILVREDDGVLITGNTIRYVGGDYANTSAGSDRCGIALATDTDWSTTAPPLTVYVRNAIVRNNHLYNIIDERTFSAIGILISVADGVNNTSNLIANNIISQVKSNPTSPNQFAGIALNGCKSDKVVFNSIYSTGDSDPHASASVPTRNSFGITINTTNVMDIMIKNNIVHIDVTSSSAPALQHADINIPASYSWGAGMSNYNDIRVAPANPQANAGCVGGQSGTLYHTLVDWQAGLTQDANSVDIEPIYTSATDLHLTVANTMLDNIGTPLDVVPADIDLEPRNFLASDMGADEFNTGCSTIVMNNSNAGAGSLRDVIACMLPGDFVRFDASLTGQTITLTTGQILLSKSIGVNGLGKNNLTLSGNSASRIFRISPTYELRLKDMALINATSVTNGGAIYAEGKLKLENVRFTNNTENGVPKSLSLVSTGMLTITSGNVEMNQ